MTNDKILKELKIKNLKGFKFGNNIIQCEITGFALYHVEYGFLSFGTNTDKKYKIDLPYNPSGGRKVLQEILKTGLTDYNNIKWVKPFTN